MNLELSEYDSDDDNISAFEGINPQLNVFPLPEP